MCMSEIFESYKHYELGNNKITALDTDVFSNQHCFKNVHCLNFTNNIITTIHSNVFIQVTNLTQLYLDFNKITTIHPNVFNVLVNLKILSFSRNEII